MTRLIDADTLRKCAIPCEIHNGTLTDLCVPLYQIDNAPTVEIPNYGGQVVPDMLQGWRYEERPQGEWIKVVENISWHYECNQCHNRPLMARLVDKDVLSEFCPNCGADMRGKEQ